MMKRSKEDAVYGNEVKLRGVRKNKAFFQSLDNKEQAVPADDAGLSQAKLTALPKGGYNDSEVINLPFGSK